MITNVDHTSGNTDIDIFDGYIDGNKQNQGSPGTIDTSSTLYFAKSSRVTIRNNTILNGCWHSARFKDCPRGILFTQNISKNAKSGHLSSDAADAGSGVCSHHTISDNYFETDVDDTISGPITLC